MSEPLWKLNVQVHRQKGQAPAHVDEFQMEADPDEYVLDVIERVWAFQDRSLTFRHACHHSTCGACGMRVNGVEKLTCITLIRDVTRDGGTIKVEPLRNFPVVSDLVVDMGLFYSRMQATGYDTVTSAAGAPPPHGADTGIRPVGETQQNAGEQRLNDCIECGLCISACPIATTTPGYLGPAVLAAIQFKGLDKRPELISMADQEDGVWRCHSVYECTAVCPSFVEPGRRIMDLRLQVIKERFKGVFSANPLNAKG